MKITIYGSGYVGLVTGTCLAEVGNDVVCVDIDAEKTAKLKDGIIPIFEPGLEEMVHSNVAAGRLTFTTDTKEGVVECVPNHFGNSVFVSIDGDAGRWRSG